MGSKRGRCDDLSLDDAKCAVSAIRKIAINHLLNSESVTTIPYPGLGTPPGRPPLDLHYIGSEWMFELFKLFARKVPRVLITGPRGYGKSSDFRAFAVFFYRWPPPEARLVCIWNMEAASRDLVGAVRNAILFAYLASAKDNIQEELEKEIQNLRSINDAIQFIKRRKNEHGEVFYFFADGWEVFDTDDSNLRQPYLEQVHIQLNMMFAEGKQVWYVASANSNAIKRTPEVHILSKVKPFDSKQFTLYSSSSILGKLSRKRQTDIDFYTGRVPLFLDVLCDCCIEFANRAAKRPSLLEFQADDCESAVNELLAAEKLLDSDQEMTEMLEDEESWDTVLKLFRQHHELKRVESNAEKINFQRTCYSIEDGTYFLLREERFCSGYIQKIYMEAFRRKKAQLHQHAGGNSTTKSCW